MSWAGADTARRNDVCRVDREKIMLCFLHGKEPDRRPRSKFVLSHDVQRDGDWIKLVMYGEHTVAERNLATGALILNHCGWQTRETALIIEPILHHFFPRTWSLLTRNKTGRSTQKRDPEWRLVSQKDAKVMPASALWRTGIEMDPGVKFEPVGPGEWKATGDEVVFFKMGMAL